AWQRPAPGGGCVPLSRLIPSPHAQSQEQLNIRTPAIQAIRDRMAQRFQGTLQRHFDSGALGFGKDGLVVVRDPGLLPLKDRVAVNAAVADDNRDRKRSEEHSLNSSHVKTSYAVFWVKKKKFEDLMAN